MLFPIASIVFLYLYRFKSRRDVIFEIAKPREEENSEESLAPVRTLALVTPAPRIAFDVLICIAIVKGETVWENCFLAAFFVPFFLRLGKCFMGSHQEKISPLFFLKSSDLLKVQQHNISRVGR